MNKIPFLQYTIILVLVFTISASFAVVEFESQKNLSNSNQQSILPQIAVSSDNVYIAWQEDTIADIFLNFSSNRGQTFQSSAVNLSNDSDDSEFPISDMTKISASEENIYVIWRNNTSTEDLLFVRSTNNGTSFDNILNISNNPTEPVIDAGIIGDDNNVYIAWQEKNSPSEIMFSTSTDFGNSFASVLNLSDDSTDSDQLQISAFRNNAYIVWRNDTTPEDIYFTHSTNNGTSFSTPINLSSDSFNSLEPKIASTKNNVYVAWRNDSSTENIAFIRSTNNGTSFSTPINLSNSTGSFADSIDIAAQDSNVAVVWRDNSLDNNEVMFTFSTDNGATFNTPVNLSDNSGSSTFPKLAINGTKTYFVWQDDTFGNNEVFFKFATQNGENVCGSNQNLSSNAGSSRNARIIATQNDVFVVWQDNTLGNDEIIFLRANSISSSCIEFDSAEYTINDTATITVSESSQSGAGSIDISIFSETDSTGIDLTLFETGVDTGVFSGTFSFTRDSSSGSILQVTPGDTITARFDGKTGTTSISPIRISFDITNPTLSNEIVITVDDPNSNTSADDFDTIVVKVTSDTQPSGINLTLSETGKDTGIFTHTTLAFMEGDDRFEVSDDVILRLSEPTSSNVQNTDSDSVDAISMIVTSTTDTTGINPVLTETGKNTGIFETIINFTTTNPSSGNTLRVVNGDILSLNFLGEIAKGIITPNPDSSVGIIEAGISDSITAIFDGVSESITIIKGSGGGGGGGGLIRPGLVLDVIAGLNAGGSTDSSPPSLTFETIQFNRNFEMPSEVIEVINNFDPLTPLEPFDADDDFDFPLEIDGYGYALSGFSNTLKTHELDVGKPVRMEFTLYEQLRLEHFTLYLNLEEDKILYDSNLYVRYENGEKTVYDPDAFLENATINVIDDGFKKTIKIDLEFKKEMDNSKIIIRAWDEKRRSSDVNIFEALKVHYQKEDNIIENSQIIEKDMTTAKESEVDTEIIMKWAGFSSESATDTEVLEEFGMRGSEIPPWYKKIIAKPLYEKDISVEEFIDALKYFEEEELIDKTR